MREGSLKKFVGLLALLASSAAFTACGASPEQAPPPESDGRATSRCEKVPKPLAKALRDGVKQGRLGRLSGVQSKDRFEGFNGLAEGAYFVSGDVRPSPGVATWIVSAEAFQTGGGVIFAVDPAARAVSDFGVDVDPSVVGASKDSDGFAESVKCAGKAG